MKHLLASLLCVALLTGCGSTDNTTTEEIVFCPADVFTCPDGTTVSRDPAADCQFTACPIILPTMNTIALTDLPAAESPGSDLQTRAPAAGDTVAKVVTSKGDVWLRLFPAETPKTVENFTGLAANGYYDDLIFHRVIPDFMIQGGDPDGRGTGGESLWGGTFADEPHEELKNIRGALSMANRGPDTNGSQFFIVQAEATPWLDGYQGGVETCGTPGKSCHTVFGQVFAGMDVVDAISAVDRDGMDKPLTDVAMHTAEVFEVE